MTNLADHIRTIKDFPKPGIGFKDITTLLKDARAFMQAIDELERFCKGKSIQKVVGIESRGFIFGAPLALRLGAGFVPVRKPKKLPAQTVREEYALEYGTDAVEIHVDAINKDEGVLIIDDLLATGGTAAATVRLVEKLGGKIAGIAFLIELEFLQGRKKLSNYEILSLIKYEKE
jgi:adenine phosphoribosyltransferase